MVTLRQRLDVVADPDLTVREHIGSQPAPVYFMGGMFPLARLHPCVTVIASRCAASGRLLFQTVSLGSRVNKGNRTSGQRVATR